MEMDNLFRMNPGFRSRFNYFLNIEDYKPEELYQILCTFANEKKYIISSEAEAILRKMIKEMYDSRDKNFANGRTIRTLFDQICKKQAERLESNGPQNLTDEQFMTILPEDVPYEAPQTVNYQECLKKLDGMVGLNAVKQEISNLAALIRAQEKPRLPELWQRCCMCWA